MSRGGNWKTSPFGLNEVDSIQTTGNASEDRTEAQTRRSRPIFMLRRAPRACDVVTVITSPFAAARRRTPGSS